MNPIKVLIVDDSKTIQNIMTMIIRSDPSMSVVGVANDAFEARDLIKTLNPDVLTVDIELPRMNGLVFIEKIMKLNPLPIVVCSSLTNNNCETSLRALELGAVDILTKPSYSSEFENYKFDLISKIKSASLVRLKSICEENVSRDKNSNLNIDIAKNKNINLISIGASTGGTEAIRSILKLLQKNSPPIIITQHLPSGFISSFADGLTKTTPIKTVVAQNQMNLVPGMAYIAPGENHLGITKDRNGFLKCMLIPGQPVSGHLPAVDVMFSNIAEINAKNTIAIVLTGMGKDGAQGLAKIHANGGVTIAQNEKSSIVWGMPKAAIDLKGVQFVLALEEIADLINDYHSIRIGA